MEASVLCFLELGYDIGPQPDSHVMWARKGSYSSKGRLGNQARKNLPEPKTQCVRLTSIGDGMMQMAGCPVCINPHLGRLSDQVRTTSHSIDSKNLLEQRLSQRRDLPGTNENTMEVSNRPLQTNLYESTMESPTPEGATW
jgi:hypothetical protein